MKHAIWFALLALLAAVAVGCASAPAGKPAPKEVVIMSWGGDYEKKVVNLFGPGFEKETGYTLKYATGGSSAEMVASIKAQASNPQIDVLVCDEGPQVLGKDLWQPIESRYLTNLGQMYDIARVPNNVYVRAFSGAVTVLYNTKVFQEKGWAPPTSWTDLWDPKYKGHVITLEGTSPYMYGLTVIAAELNGGSEKNMEPGWQKMKDLAPSIAAFSTSASRFGDLFAQGTGWIGLHSEGSALRHRMAGIPVGTAQPKEGLIFVPAAAAVVKGGPNPDGAQKLVNYLLTPEAQKAWSENFGYGPLNKNVQLSADLAAQVTYGPERVAKLKVLDWQQYNEGLSKFVERWNKEIATK